LVLLGPCADAQSYGGSLGNEGSIVASVSIQEEIVDIGLFGLVAWVAPQRGGEIEIFHMGWGLIFFFSPSLYI
jgi:hypothetical protein